MSKNLQTIIIIIKLGGKLTNKIWNKIKKTF